jgi:hypothetical protein
MANAKPVDLHNSHDHVPTAPDAPKPKEMIRLIDVSGKAVKLVNEEKLACGTIRRDYE